MAQQSRSEVEALTFLVKTLGCRLVRQYDTPTEEEDDE